MLPLACVVRAAPPPFGRLERSERRSRSERHERSECRERSERLELAQRGSPCCAPGSPACSTALVARLAPTCTSTWRSRWSALMRYLQPAWLARTLYLALAWPARMQYLAWSTWRSMYVQLARGGGLGVGAHLGGILLGAVCRRRSLAARFGRLGWQPTCMGAPISMGRPVSRVSSVGVVGAGRRASGGGRSAGPVWLFSVLLCVSRLHAVDLRHVAGGLRHGVVDQRLLRGSLQGRPRGTTWASNLPSGRKRRWRRNRR